MKRMTAVVLAAAAVWAVACSPANPAQCKCSSGGRCVWIGAAAEPTCALACAELDGGACPSGLSCGCAGSCQGCKDCVSVCQ